MSRSALSLIPTFGSRRRDAPSRPPPPEPPTAVAPIDPAPDPLASVLNMLDGVGCLTRNLTGLAADLRAHPDRMPEQLADAAGRATDLHQRLEAICSEVGALRLGLAQHGPEGHTHA